METLRRRVSYRVLAGLAAAAALAWHGGLGRFDAVLYDSISRLVPATPSAEVVVVAIDEPSLAQVGRWPWDRDRQVDLIERIAAQSPAAIGLDMLLSEPASDPEVDLRLAQAVRRAGNVVLPVFNAQGPGGGLRLMLPVAPLAAAARKLGHVSIEPDADGVVRSVFLHEGVGDQGWDHFAAALLEVAGRRLPRPLPGVRAPAAVQGRGWWRDNWMLIDYAGPGGTYRTVSAADVLSGRAPAQALRNKIVLVGASATGLGDVYPTPLSRAGSFTPGVEVSANILGNLLAGDARVPLPPAAAAALTLALCVLVLPGLWLFAPLWALAAAAGGLMLALAASAGLLLAADLWFPPAAALLAIIVFYLAWNWRRLERAASYLVEELSRLRGQDPALVRAEHRAARGDLIDRYIHDLALARDRLQQAEQRRDQALRFLSHDIRAPQAAILALLDLNETDPGYLSEAELLARIRKHVARTQGLAESFVELAKVATVPLKREPVDCADLVLDVVDECWASAQRKNIELESDVPDDGAWVLGDRALLMRALTNLVGNAIKYSPAATRVECRLSRDGDGWRIAVKDQGRGIPADQLDRLFGEFTRVQAPPGHAEEPGFGLGLAFTKAVVERHGGRVTCDSELGRGSEFRIHLAAAEPARESA